MSTLAAAGEFHYPTGAYEGIELICDLTKLADDPNAVLAGFGIDLGRLVDSLMRGVDCRIMTLSRELEETLRAMWNAQDSLDEHRLKFAVTHFLFQLMDFTPERESHGHYFTSTQVALANSAAAEIEGNLSKRLTVAEVAEHLGVSPTSLKSYFKGVYGENASAFQRRLRMERAADLLDRTDSSVSEVARAVGYENQGKFAAVFKKQYGHSPLEYRRAHRL